MYTVQHGIKLLYMSDNVKDFPGWPDPQASGTVAGHHGCGSSRWPGSVGGGWSAGLTVFLVS